MDKKYHPRLGVVAKGGDLTDMQAFGVEAVLTFMLIQTILGVCDERRPDSRATPALSIGFVVTANILGGVSWNVVSLEIPQY